MNCYVLATLSDSTKRHGAGYESACGGNSIFWTVNHLKDRRGHITTNLAAPKSYMGAQIIWNLWLDFPALAVNCQMISKVSVSLDRVVGPAAAHTNRRKSRGWDFLTCCTNVRPGLHPGFHLVFEDVSIHKL